MLTLLAEEIINPLIEVRKSSLTFIAILLIHFLLLLMQWSVISTRLACSEEQPNSEDAQNKIGELHEIILGNIKGCKLKGKALSTMKARLQK